MRASALLATMLLSAPLHAQWLHDPVTLPAGDSPVRLAAGDLDEDGRNDVVSLNKQTFVAAATLSILLGESGGSLGYATTFPIISETNDLALGDMTGEGHLDVVTSNSIFVELAIYPGNGNGTLSAPTTWPVGERPYLVALADLDLDGDLDVVTVDAEPFVANTVSVHLGNGAGALAAAVTYPAPDAPENLTVALHDADALPDVLFSTDTGEFLMKGLGGGALAPAAPACPLNADDHDLADLDNDGILDLVLGRVGTADTALGDGAGSFTPTDSQAGGLGSSQVGAGDFDQDGAPDVACAHFKHWSLHVFPGDGQGGIDDGPFDVLPGAPGVVLVAELTGDGRPDVVTTAPNDDALFVLPANDGRLRLGFLQEHFVAANSGLRAVVSGDLDDDGHADAVVAMSFTDKLGRLLGDGLGDLGSPASYTAGDAPVDVGLADLDGDGDLDAVLALVNADAVSVHLGDGLGAFGPGTSYPGFDGCGAVALGDMDGNGTVDVLADSVTLTELRLYPGGGDGTLLPATSLPLPAQATLALGDLNGDLAPDLVLAYPLLEIVEPRLNDGAGAFVAGMSVRVGYQADRPVVADVDGDGAQDVVATTGSSGFQVGTVALLVGDGAGALQPPQHDPVPYLLSLGAGDLNGDGRPEVLGTSIEVFVDTFPVTSYDIVHVFAADGEGGLSPGSFLANEAGTSGVAVADLDEDGRLEVLLTDEGNSSTGIFVALNLSEPHPWHDLGEALAGEHGEPVLVAIGWAEPGTPGVLRLSGAQPLAVAVLFVSPVSTPSPFKGGLLVPVPPVLAAPLVTSAGGEVELPWDAWPALTPGSTWYLQAGVADAGGPAGVALSNALQLIQP